MENHEIKKTGGSNPLVVLALLFGIIAGLITMGRNASEKNASAQGGGFSEFIVSYLPK
ncbi:MAG: hypothetical protein ACOYMS_09135 [Terrimicrobiaceae bacterium]